MTMVGRWFATFWNWVVGPTFDADVEEVRQATCRLCGFLPTLATVANIMSLGTLSTVSAVAMAICNAVTAKKWTFVSAGDPPTVEGIVIEGEWVVK
jgi:hypothetical protein